MSAAILQACTPLLGALFVCGGLLLALARMGQFQLDWRRLVRINGDERGGVQSVSFVLTFPIFLLLVLFVVQISQLMVGVAVVHYAAFAAARAASVWIPADAVTDPTNGRSDSQNQLPPELAPGRPWLLTQDVVESLGSRKCQEIWLAGALACVPISPARAAPSSAKTPAALAQQLAGSLAVVVNALDPAARSNARMPARLSIMLNYSLSNTSVEILFQDRSSQAGGAFVHTYNPASHPNVHFIPSEVGWQDPVSVTVRHRLALLPGPGRWLAAALANGDGRVVFDQGVYKTTLAAAATMTIEGLQSLHPTVHPAPR